MFPVKSVLSYEEEEEKEEEEEEESAPLTQTAKVKRRIQTSRCRTRAEVFSDAYSDTLCVVTHFSLHGVTVKRAT